MKMQTYMLALKGGFDNWSERAEAERKEIMNQFAAWAEKLSQEGRYQDCVRPVGENRRVTRAGSQIHTDGPFPETKEVISGIFFIKAKDIQDATEVAKSSPVLNYGGSVEVFSLTEDRSE
jgi:hypothetical protein